MSELRIGPAGWNYRDWKGIFYPERPARGSSELEYLAGHELKDPKEQDRHAMALVRRGAARMVAVTLGAEGALLATDVGVFRVPAMDEPMHSSVGAGDAFLAAATLALARGGTPADALIWGTAAGAAAIARASSSLRISIWAA